MEALYLALNSSVSTIHAARIKDAQLKTVSPLYLPRME